MATPDQVVPLVVKAFYEEGEGEKVVSVNMDSFRSDDTSWGVEFVGQQSDGEQSRLIFVWESDQQKGYYQGIDATGQAEPVDSAEEEAMTDYLSAAGDSANFEEIEKQLAALEAQNKALEQRLATEAHKARVIEITNFCEQHRNRLTINPTASDAVDLGESSTSLVDFMAGLDDKGLSFMQGFIKSLPAQVPTGEVATDFSEPEPAANFSEAIAEARAKLQSIFDANRNGGGN